MCFMLFVDSYNCTTQDCAKQGWWSWSGRSSDYQSNALLKCMAITEIGARLFSGLRRADLWTVKLCGHMQIAILCRRYVC